MKKSSPKKETHSLETSSPQAGSSGAAPGLSRLHAVIMAGGSGTRFWPMSRQDLPKQFLALTGNKSLLRETFERLLPLVGAERMWVVSGASHARLVAEELPEIPRENILGEPVGRNTAPCIGLAARRILEKDPGGFLLVCPADHVIRPAAAFAGAVSAALGLLESLDGGQEPWTLTFGIVPRYAATGFGYIERGEGLGEPRAEGAEPLQAYRVKKFKEKPPEEVARGYVESGNFYWNSGMFLWRAADVKRLIEIHLPRLAEGLAEIHKLSRDQGIQAALEARFGLLPSISIDFGVLEPSKNVAVIAADFEWDDVGSWRAVERYTAQDGSGNNVVGKHVGVATQDCILVGKKRLIATVGVKDLVVVETEDAILVCSRDATERVKEIPERLREKEWTEYL